MGQTEHIWLKCQRAKDLEEGGHYEEAAAELAAVWSRVGERPVLDGLDEGVQAELLLRAGVLTGWIGSARQIQGAQETAKDFISESIRRLAALSLTVESANALIDLAICYWREGGLAEARDQLSEAMAHAVGDRLVTGRALLNLSVVEISANRYRSALDALDRARPLFAEGAAPVARGRFHSQLALCYQLLGFGEQREDYLERALGESAIASQHFEEAGHIRYLARVENNVGNVLYKMGRYDEALRHMDRARELLIPLKDSGTVAQINEARARVFLLQGRNAEAQVAASGAVHILERGDEAAILTEALIAQGTAFARLDDHLPAMRALRHAVEVAERSGNLAGAGCATLTMLEELFGHLDLAGRIQLYTEADRLLGDVEDGALRDRLRRAARRVLDGLSGGQEQVHFADFLLGSSLDDEMLRFEAALIRRALDQSGGKVTEAARRLGVTHQRLGFILQTRHQALMPARTPIQRRRRSIIKK